MAKPSPSSFALDQEPALEQFIHRPFQCFGDQGTLFGAEATFEHPHTILIGIPGQFTQSMRPVIQFQGFIAFGAPV